ncbi:MAG TPA: N-acetylglucosamine-6-phosphate deacetylase [Clostridia bacterium]|nr:N-acetylglucosamine-6-phosphate deacetylase [Clostridia bacterium]
MKTFLNARLVCEDRIIQCGFLTEKDGIITALGDMSKVPASQGEVVECQGLYLSPGFIDLHTHGAGGYDFMDGDVRDVIGAARAHMAHGTTALMPTTLTSDDKDLYAAIDAYHLALETKESRPHFLGMHLEGPYFSGEYKGAQDERYLMNPYPEHYLNILAYAKGHIKRWSLAPELSGALEMADRLADNGILLSAAHTSATFEQMQEAFKHGFTHLTHFYSAMSSIVRVNGMRTLGVVESGYLLDGLTLEIISDGIHIPPDLLRMILRFKSHDAICLCTDSMRGAGMPDGVSILGSKKDGQQVIVENGIALMPDKSCFAGSVATTDRLVRVMVYQAGLSVWEAVKMMSLNPAKFMKLDSVIGSLDVGKQADLVLFDNDISIKSVYVSGIKTIDGGLYL